MKKPGSGRLELITEWQIDRGRWREWQSREEFNIRDGKQIKTQLKLRQASVLT